MATEDVACFSTAVEGSPESFQAAQSCCVSLEFLSIQEGGCKQSCQCAPLAEHAASVSAPQMGDEHLNYDGDDGKLDEVWLCAICRDKIKVEETAQIKGCEHSYCVTCILRWASYKAEPWCPQCRLPFSFLYVYRALDGSLNDYMLEESVCLLLRAPWFKPLSIQEIEEHEDYQEEYDMYEEYSYTSTVRLGNRRWGDSGYVRAGRKEARPVGVRQVGAAAGGSGEASSSSSRQAKGKEQAKEMAGRRAKRAQKREAADKLAAAKPQQQQQRFETQLARARA